MNREDSVDTGSKRERERKKERTPNTNDSLCAARLAAARFAQEPGLTCGNNSKPKAGSSLQSLGQGPHALPTELAGPCIEAMLSGCIIRGRISMQQLPYWEQRPRAEE